MDSGAHMSLGPPRTRRTNRERKDVSAKWEFDAHEVLKRSPLPVRPLLARGFFAVRRVLLIDIISRTIAGLYMETFVSVIEVTQFCRLPDSVHLLCRTNQDLVDAYPLRLADGVGYGVRNVLGLERLYAPLLQPLADFLVGDVVG